MPSTPARKPATRAPSAKKTLLTLLDAVQELSKARRIEEIQEVIRGSARELLNADGASFVLREDEMCFYADEDAVSPLWKGQRFALDSSVSGWAMLNAKSVVIEDVDADDRVPQEDYKPTFVKSLLVVPIRTADPLGAIGIYWAERHRATDREVAMARALADSTAVALEYVDVLEELELTQTLADSDPLTGLPNRRAWDRALGAALDAGTRPLCVAMIDLDGFEDYTDARGDAAGDRLLLTAAATWRAALRTSDVLARHGDEEFAVLMPYCGTAHAERVATRLCDFVPEGVPASVGIAEWDGSEDAAALLRRAAEALDVAKEDEGVGVLVAS